MELDFDVCCFEFKPTQKKHTPLYFLKQLGFILKYYRKNCLFVSQFAGYHSFLPSLFGKILKNSSLIVSGGTDCVAFPSINYGNLRKTLLGKFTRWSYQLATHIAPVDESLVYCSYSYQNNDGLHQGIKAHLPNLKTPIIVIYNGYGHQFYRIPSIKKDPDLFLTVASGIESKSRYELKGVDLFVHLAQKFPNKKFIIIGAKKVPESLPKNVELLPFVANKDLITYYNKATYYVQLSLSEGFPNSLCEAMLCECIPLVSAVGAMPNIVEDAGFILAKKSTDDLEQLCLMAIESDLKSLGLRAANKIREKYDFSKRQKMLLHLLHSL